ncbi:sodium-dependent transporter [Flocculibacter collagenilyticus]|uniref:sodium-dependent transporter n=1 Tax=Flocculibacter collagenilyticus TaxID=2744479 RepID=UPI0018F5CCA6|nr:sodium-dependent transporter [Flocculibacter collagenilyticus]
MNNTRDGFNSRIGFVLAAAGSAIGLGNIWGFPTQAANHGGGAFLMVYLLVLFLLALPAMFTEMYIGHTAQANPVKALGKACGEKSALLGKTAGIIGLFGAIGMLSFYSIVAGWMVSHSLAPLAELAGQTQAKQWLNTNSLDRNLFFTPIFILLTAAIIIKGVSQGIEKWSRRLMPLLLVMLISLIIYIAMQEGAAEGIRAYLIPDFSNITDPKLIISAMGQAFFSLSIGVGGMMVYGSYLKKEENLVKLSISVAALDTVIAVLAGLLIIPALFVAQHQGIEVYNNGALIGEGQLIFGILPQLFNQMGEIGIFVGFAFFFLLSIAALTSTISSTEVPVAYIVESKFMDRRKATLLVSLVVLVASMTIIFNFNTLFGFVINVVTNYHLPIMGLFYFIVVGWLWKRGNVLFENQTKTIKLLAYYIKFVCPIMLTAVFLNIVSA